MQKIVMNAMIILFIDAGFLYDLLSKLDIMAQGSSYSERRIMYGVARPSLKICNPPSPSEIENSLEIGKAKAFELPKKPIRILLIQKMPHESEVQKEEVFLDTLIEPT